jgi:hypothetical protein
MAERAIALSRNYNGDDREQQGCFSWNMEREEAVRTTRVKVVGGDQVLKLLCFGQISKHLMKYY